MTRPTAHPLIARLFWLSVATALLLFGSTLLDECVAKPIKFTKRADVTEPVMLSATLASNGTDTTVVFDRPMVADDAAGFSLIVAAVPRELTLASGSNTDTFVFTSSVVYEDEIVSLAYASAIGDAEDTNGYDLENAGIDVTNNSTQVPTPDDTTPPQYVSSTIASNGTNVVYVFDEAVVLANATGFTFTPSGGAATLAYVSGSGTTTISFTASRAIESDETATTQYSSTTGDVEDLYGNDLATFGSTAVTNNSTYDSSDPYIPAPPETFNTDYDLPTGGTTWTPGNFAQLQSDLYAAEPGDVIVLQAGTTYDGALIVPDKGAGTDWIYIISSNLASLPPEGERVSMSDAANMPRLTSNAYAALTTNYAAHHYRVVGVEFAAGTRDVLTLIQTGYGGPLVSALPAYVEANLPHHITFDRCLIHSTSDAHRLRHGIMLNGLYMAVVDCYIANCKDTQDAMAIFTYNGDGPYKIVNNFLEGSSENLIIGGTDPSIPGSIPADIEIRGNHLFKRMSWKAANTWNIKNNYELKNAQRVLFSGNVLENCWTRNQDGTSVLYTVRNQSGTAPWCIVQDADFENNIITNVGAGISITGGDNNHPSQQTHRVRFRNNLIDVTSTLGNVQPTFIRAANLAAQTVRYLTVTHNTCFTPIAEHGPFTNFQLINAAINADGVIFQNNIMTHGAYNTVWSRAANATHSHNVLYLDSSSARYAWNKANFNSQNPGDFMADADPASVGFVDFDGGNLRLDAGSPYAAGNANDATDGTDQGCDIDELEAATAGAVSGVW